MAFLSVVFALSLCLLFLVKTRHSGVANSVEVNGETEIYECHNSERASSTPPDSPKLPGRAAERMRCSEGIPCV